MNRLTTYIYLLTIAVLNVWCLPAYSETEQAAFERVQREGSVLVAGGEYGTLVDFYSSAIQQRKWSPAHLSRLYLERGLGKRKQNDITAALEDFERAERLMPAYSDQVLTLAKAKANAHYQQALLANGVSELLRLYQKYKQPEPLAKVMGDFYLNRVGDLVKASEYYVKAGSYGLLGQATIKSLGQRYDQVTAAFQPLLSEKDIKQRMRYRMAYAEALNRTLSAQQVSDLSRQQSVYVGIINDCKNQPAVAFVCRQGDMESKAAAYLALNLLQQGQPQKASRVAEKYFPKDEQAYQWPHYIAGAYALSQTSPQRALGTVKNGLRATKPTSKDLSQTESQNAYVQLCLAQYALAQQNKDKALQISSIKRASRWANAWQLGEIYRTLSTLYKADGDLEKTADALNQAIEYTFDPYAKANLYVALTDAYYLQSKKAQALASLKAAAGFAPLSPELWASMAVMEKETGNVKAYQRLCKGAYASSPYMKNVCKTRAERRETFPRYRPPVE